MKNLKLSEFQLSQSCLFFYDKLEKANYYLEYVVSQKVLTEETSLSLRKPRILTVD